MTNAPKTLYDYSDDEALLVLWDEATAEAEASDEWSRVAELEAEVKRRGLA